MTGDGPKWLDGVVRSWNTVGFEFKKAICMYDSRKATS